MKAALVVAALLAAAPPDRDGDGVVDGEDPCPDRAGLADDGCPPRDGDGDGLLDGDDACPEAPGPRALRGCPDLDDDRDGVVDRDDRCVGLAGPADYMGCPPPDADGDAVADGADACPEAAELWNGIDDRDGCPDGVPDSVLVRYRPGVLELLPCEAAREAVLCSGPAARRALPVAQALLRKVRARAVEVVVVAEHGRSYGDSLQRARRRAERVRDQLGARSGWPAPLTIRAAGPDGRPRVELHYR